jgi:quercetin dioxygenase-like cupin family protein
VLLAVLPACGQESPPIEAFRATNVTAVYEEPRHRVIYQNPFVWVLELRLPPGDTTGWHYHPAPMVAVAVQGGRMLDQVPDAAPRPIPTPRATPYVFENWSKTVPYTHRVINADTIPVYDVVAEWHTAYGQAVAALPNTPNRRLIKEGKTARVYEIRLAPGDSTEAHVHAAPGLTVLATPGALSDDGHPEATGGTGAGSWSWHGASYRHVLRNDGAERLIVYEIDWR